MFGDKKRQEMMNDPQKALDNANKTLNKGMTGFMTKAFMGKGFTEQMNQGLAMGQEALDMQKMYQNPEQFGPQASAVVVSMQDTGALINYNPVVVMQLKVTPQSEPPFETTVQTMVSKIAIPRVGDTINIRYMPADHTKVIIV